MLNQTQEDFFSKNIETPLGLFKKHHLNNPDLQDRKVYRAPFIYIIFQLERIRLAKKKERLMAENPFNKDVFEFDEVEIEHTVIALEQQYKLVALNTEKGDFLFFPETGFFQFPVFDSNKHIDIFNCFAIPVSLNTALCLVPNIVDTEMILNSKKNLTLFSVGLNNEFCAKIILPPLDKLVSDEELKDIILKMREDAIKFQRELEEIQKEIKSIRGHV